MPIDPDQLEELIGRQVSYRGRVFTIVEVLPERPALVLAERGSANGIQANQFGEAVRRAPRTLTIPVREPNGDLHPLMREITLT